MNRANASGMWGRYANHTGPGGDFGSLFAIWTPNFRALHCRATQPVTIVSMWSGPAREYFAGAWGLIPAWVKDTRDFLAAINARGESVLEKSAFKNA